MGRGFVNYDLDIHVYYADMPYSIKSNVVENADGSYTLYLNSRLSHEANLKGYLHELRHICNNDLEFCNDVQETEFRTHNLKG